MCLILKVNHENIHILSTLRERGGNDKICAESGYTMHEYYFFQTIETSLIS